MQPKNSKVKAGIVRNPGTDRELTDKEAKERRVAQLSSKSKLFSKVSDKIAGDDFHVRNYPIPKGKEMFPAEWRMQYVDLFYPYAKDENGESIPLYMDMPVTTFDIELCERKMKELRQKNLRYTYIKAGESEWDGVMRLQGQDPEKIKADQAALMAKGNN